MNNLAGVTLLVVGSVGLAIGASMINATYGTITASALVILWGLVVVRATR